MTVEELRAISKASIAKKENDELLNVISNIERSAEAGNYSVKLGFAISQNNIKILQDKGLKCLITYGDEYNEWIDTTLITWYEEKPKAINWFLKLFMRKL